MPTLLPLFIPSHGTEPSCRGAPRTEQEADPFLGSLDMRTLGLKVGKQEFGTPIQLLLSLPKAENCLPSPIHSDLGRRQQGLGASQVAQ